MAKFICILKNEKKENLTKDLIKGHIEHLKEMKNNGILFLCGLLKNNESGMVILEVKSYEEAESYILQDPLIVNNCYGDYIIYELIEANEENNYLQDK
jgi:uncharacterized protein YciI